MSDSFDGFCGLSAPAPLNAFKLFVISQFVGLESMMSAFVDLMPNMFKKPWRREIFLAFLCFTQFLVGVSMITNVSTIREYVASSCIIGELKTRLRSQSATNETRCHISLCI